MRRNQQQPRVTRIRMALAPGMEGKSRVRLTGILALEMKMPGLVGSGDMDAAVSFLRSETGHRRARVHAPTTHHRDGGEKQHRHR